MSAPKSYEDDTGPVASLDAPANLLGRPTGRPRDETETATVWVTAKPARTKPGKAEAT